MADRDRSASASAGAPGGRRVSLAEKLGHLFDVTVNPATGRRYTNAEVSQSIAQECGGVRVAESTIASIRTGVKPNPTLKTIEALARIFKVAPDYFFPDFDVDETAKVQASFELIRAVKDSGLQGIAMRANGLSPASLEMITAVINQARRLEGLDPTGE
ncbi:transcriptional regulator [Streptomyces sp. NPDC092952]|uniref:transcriptional regulator n=1 Tax=Streptomyces sp. NPDC092952 TaxID=3366018 RepID=UPI0037F30142